MAKDSVEKWKQVKFDFDHANDFRLEVSNLGRIRTFNKISKGEILKGSMINGYPIVRIKLFKGRDRKTNKDFVATNERIASLAKELKDLKEKGNAPKWKKLRDGINSDLKNSRKIHSANVKADEKKRTIYYHSL